MNPSIPTLFMRFPEGKAKALTFSYDDGLYSDLRLIGILNAHKMRGTFNIISSVLRVGDETYRSFKRLSKEELKEAFRDGIHEVALHGYTHTFLAQLSKEEVVQELTKDREILEGLLHRDVRGMSYPFGSYNDMVIEAADKCGVAYARIANSSGNFSLPNNWLTWAPTCHNGGQESMELAKTFLELQVTTSPQLFYLWGHTFEFDKNDDWWWIEDFTSLMATHEEELWYATNMEIYQYVEDYKRLIFLDDGKSVYNPTGRTLFFASAAGGASIAIAPDETLSIA